MYWEPPIAVGEDSLVNAGKAKSAGRGFDSFLSYCAALVKWLRRLILSQEARVRFSYAVRAFDE